jgi:fatty acid desaturase
VTADSATRHWAHGLTPEARTHLRALHRIEPWRLLKIPAFFGACLAAVAGAAWSERMWVAAPCCIFAGLCLHGLGVFMHEGAHGNLTRRPGIDRLIGFLCGLPAGVSCSNYRATHELHHRFENTDRDPDNMATLFASRWSRPIVYYCWFFLGMPVYALVLTLTGPLRAVGSREKVLCILETLLILAFYYLLITVWLEDASLYAWLAALASASITANVRGLAEHTLLPQGDPPNPFQSTRSTVSNKAVSFFFNNQNYHLEHHLFPRAPWYNLPKLHDLLESNYRAQQAAVCRGYLDYLSAAICRGPMHETRHGATHAVSATPLRSNGP